MTTPIIEKISLLLNKAERAATPEEAEAYFEKAQQIATKNAIDIETARAAGGAKTSTMCMKIITLGKKRQFGLYTYVKLFHNIADANDVRIAVTQDSVYVYAYGYDTDIQIVETLFASLLLQMTHASATYIAKGEYKNERVWRDGYWENYGGDRGREWVSAGYKQVHGSTARNSFQEAFAERVGQRLREARRAAVQTASTGAELVLVSKANAVANYYDQNSGAKGNYTGGQGATRSRSAMNAGVDAANKARLGGSEVHGSAKGALH